MKPLNSFLFPPLYLFPPSLFYADFILFLSFHLPFNNIIHLPNMSVSFLPFVLSRKSVIPVLLFAAILY